MGACADCGFNDREGRRFGPSGGGAPVARARSRRVGVVFGLLLVAVFWGDTTARAVSSTGVVREPSASFDSPMSVALRGGAESGSAEFGYAVAESADGNTVLIGGPDDDGGRGAAWVFTRSAGGWRQQGSKLTGSGSAGGFGSAVALSTDGDTALIGAPTDGAGAAWLFSRVGGVWKRQGARLAGRGTFGASVALSAQGDTALIGGPDDDGGVGAAWVFTRASGSWRQQGPKLTGSEASEFGSSVALSAAGSTALVGGPGASGSAGAAWVFARSGGVWRQQGPELTGGSQPFGDLVGSWYGVWDAGPVPIATMETAIDIDINRQQANGRFSGTVDLAYGQGFRGVAGRISGTLGAVGAGAYGVEFTGSLPAGPAASAAPNPAREPVSFTGLGGPDSLVGSLTWGNVTHAVDFETDGSPVGTAQFGFSVALSADGDTALIGGPFDSTSGGAGWIFTRSNGVWSPQSSEPAGGSLEASKLTGSGENLDGEFGWSLALSADGNTALIGGPANGAGTAWVFVRSRGRWTQRSRLTGSNEHGAGEFGQALAMPADGTAAVIGARGDDYAAGTARAFPRP